MTDRTNKPTPSKSDELSEDPLQFPVELTVKAMGLASPDFEQLVGDLVNVHLDADTPAQVSTLESSKGKYVSVRVKFVAQDRPQLEAIYRDLHANDRVLFTL